MKHRREFLSPHEPAGAETLTRVDEALLAAIIEEAQRRGIELTSDRELLAALASLGGEERIPPALYAAIATALTWLSGVAETLPESARDRPDRGAGSRKD